MARNLKKNETKENKKTHTLPTFNNQNGKTKSFFKLIFSYNVSVLTIIEMAQEFEHKIQKSFKLLM